MTTIVFAVVVGLIGVGLCVAAMVRITLLSNRAQVAPELIASTAWHRPLDIVSARACAFWDDILTWRLLACGSMMIAIFMLI